MKAFKMYRIVCTITEKALVSRSDMPNWHPPHQPYAPKVWYHRGDWSETAGSFWRGEDTVRRHLRNLCCDWDRQWHPNWRTMPNREATWLTPGPPDWSRLKHLRVEQFLVTSHTVTMLDASDFMGIAIGDAA